MLGDLWFSSNADEYPGQSLKVLVIACKRWFSYAYIKGPALRFDTIIGSEPHFNYQEFKRTEFLCDPERISSQLIEDSLQKAETPSQYFFFHSSCYRITFHQFSLLVIQMVGSGRTNEIVTCGFEVREFESTTQLSQLSVIFRPPLQPSWEWCAPLFYQ